MRPVTKYLCRNGYKAMIGAIVAMVAAALIVIGVTVCADAVWPPWEAPTGPEDVAETLFRSFMSSYCNVVYSGFILL